MSSVNAQKVKKPRIVKLKPNMLRTEDNTVAYDLDLKVLKAYKVPE
jgi:hypothetical protein